MALVDAKYRFIWANCGLAGNTHDSMIFQKTLLYKKILEDGIIPDFDFVEGGCKINPVILADSAFEFKSWLMKPYTHAILTKEQKYFNYIRARMIIESAFGQLKGRWRILLRKCESSVETVKLMSLTCIVLHNLCIELEDVPQRNWDLNNDQSSNKQTPRNIVRELLQMRTCSNVQNRNPTACIIRNKMTEKFWAGHENGNV